MSNPTPAKELVDRIRDAEPNHVERGLAIIRAWDDELAARGEVTAERLIAELVYVQVRVTNGERGGEGVGPDLAEALLVTFLAERWSGKTFWLIGSMCSEVAALARKEARWRRGQA